VRRGKEEGGGALKVPMFRESAGWGKTLGWDESFFRGVFGGGLVTVIRVGSDPATIPPLRSPEKRRAAPVGMTGFYLWNGWLPRRGEKADPSTAQPEKASGCSGPFEAQGKRDDGFLFVE
jgi:hypothetical protein